MKLMKKKLKQYNYESIFISCITILIGTIMILFSKNVLNIISYLLGGILVITGIIKIYYYFRYEGKYNIFNYELSFGILNILLGILCIIFRNELQSIFRILIGLIVIYEGILSISLASKILYVNKGAGIISLLLSISMILCGGLIIFIKGIVIATIGYIIIVFAVMNIIESFIFNRNISKLENFLSKLNIE